MTNPATGVLVESLDRHVLTLTLNRPAQRNALSAEMLDALATSLDRAAADPDVAVVVLTGAGPGFCAGGDVKVLARGESIFGPMSDRAARAQRQIELQRATAVRLWEFPKPTIAAVNGHAVGAGLALALACDLRYAGESAQLRPGFSAVGLAGDFGVTWLLNNLVGRSRAQEMLFFAQPLPSARSLELGLVNAVFPDDDLAAETTALARELAGRSIPAIRAIKENIAIADHVDLAHTADAEVQWHVRLLETSEHREAVASTLARRV
ncbi:enoyl-CoA hydratase-related protein [Gordonia rhizosphera]|uniref:Putative enoyl-CoA hydratase n=1 Tax=Gordonia rhizosphera NBRC 16068 TaxID=1108045 RepID=K6W762_9ACTN|nr:enoyl-CoA hydratase-related protein [Gordonia rhizosphera]GAB89566.1 putative enoyl-CoA hydratase [Gordonia rhizosphera NBRC 16068]